MANKVKENRRAGEPEKRSTAHGRDRVSASPWPRLGWSLQGGPMPPVSDSLLQADQDLTRPSS
jgi:hypothetical protein